MYNTYGAENQMDDEADDDDDDAVCNAGQKSSAQRPL